MYTCFLMFWWQLLLPWCGCWGPSRKLVRWWQAYYAVEGHMRVSGEEEWGQFVELDLDA